MNILLVVDSMQVVKELNGKMMAINAEEKQIFSGLALKIMRSLSEGEKYPKQISRELKINEQKIYYHVRQLEKKGFVKITRKEEKSGALAKLYKLSSPAFVARFGEFREARRIPRSGFEPFIKNGLFSAKIIVGSPDPHGPEKARSRDITFAVDLALFLGTFLAKVEAPAVIEDKDTRSEDLRNNLIVIGGPVTNKVMKMVNEKLPVRFDAKKNIISKNKVYKNDDCGFIAKADSPFGPGKILVIAGKRYSGTKAAVLAFIRHFDSIENKNFTVVEGLDNDGDGEIDGVRILE
ncbi:MAG: ArsR family transcriptional regulator [Candidatus Aenigmarchaeota archaeon]|nr:ArsR family transcriptional regulator [Candidatus Aenigmarchaeota archaeon]